MCDEFQELWPMAIADDSKSKKRWNIMVGDKKAGGVYATSLAGQVTGFRAGHMAPGWNGAIILDDPLKPEDAFSPSKLEAANRRLLTTMKSRKANPSTPIVIIMQRISEKDPTAFIEEGNVPGDWKIIKIPALLTKEHVHELQKNHQVHIDTASQSKDGRVSYWPYKEPVEELLLMESGMGKDATGSRMSRFVFASQYQQSPVALGGNLIRGECFGRYKILPQLKYRCIYADTAQKTSERNDYSVFQCWGEGKEDGKAYLVDQIRGRWEAPELKRRAVAFWRKHLAFDRDKFGALRGLKIEDKSSGTGLIQSIASEDAIAVFPIERNKDKLTRLMDAMPYIESGLVCVPEAAEFTNDLISECESFAADMTHEHDDQVDPLMDAISDILSSDNLLRTWEKLV
jgi:phage uncharacterized protein (putative large terminase), C-terminal domain